MSSIAASDAVVVTPKERLAELFEELSELTGQRNAIDGRIVDIVAEIDHGELCGMTGARSVSALVAWRTASTKGNADAIAAIAHRIDEFPRCTAGLREGRLSLDQVEVIAQHGGTGSDAHYAELAAVATVSQLRKAISLEPPPPQPNPRPEPPRAISKTSDEQSTTWRIKLPHHEAATFDAALQSHLDGLITQWKQDRDDSGPSETAPPLPPTTSSTGNTAAPPNWTTSSCSAPTTTGCTTKAASPSPDPPTPSPSPTTTANH